MKVRFKKLHEDAVSPEYAKYGDAGMDLVATSYKFEGSNFVYGTGLAVEIPDGHVGLLFPRSSISNKPLKLTNSVGVIDSGYRGEIIVKFDTDTDYYMDGDIPKVASEYEGANIGDEIDIYKVGDKVIQLMILPFPRVHFEEVKELEVSERGEGGFGSTGK